MNWCENVILLALTDSTNNYAMRLIDADKAQPGTLILAQRQAAGKGQRGRQWQDAPGESLLMSLILTPQIPLNQQFNLSMIIAVAVTDILCRLLPQTAVAIKWPNDIILNDKKAGGILIENQLRGSSWLYAVAGIGLNVAQRQFPDLPHATSIALQGGQPPDLTALAMEIRREIAVGLAAPGFQYIQNKYIERLYRKDLWQRFGTPEGEVLAEVAGILPDGRLCLRLPDGGARYIWHGEWEWIW